MKGLFKLISLALPIIFLAFFADNSYAANTSYLVTEAREIGPPTVGGVGQILLVKLLTVNYQGGKMVLSADPEGTQSAAIGDTLIIDFAYPSSGRFVFESRSKDCKTHIPMPPTDITRFFSTQNQGINNLTFRYADWCGGKKQISSLYLVNIESSPSPTPSPSPSPSPTPSPTPTPTPAPFLDLPWDYEGNGLTFNEAANLMSSFLDHEYPLLSSGISEPSSSSGTIIPFFGPPQIQESYSRHDGYDYAKAAKVYIGNPVLAAADGIATLGDKTKCSACGNYILIDHENGYQTRYYHLEDNSPIVKELSKEVHVAKGQEIGKTGATGNVTGAHIHFMVIQDKNNDGNFDDNIPDGITDPFGWQSAEKDPWPEFSWKIGEDTKTGNASYYLWTKPIANLSGQLTANGGFFQLERYKLNFPSGATQENLNLQMNSSPVVRVSDILKSIGSTIVITAKNIAGYQIKSFFQPFTINIDFSGFDISPFKPETVSIYSSEDGITWTKEPTTVDFTEKTASANVNHLSYFALVGERADVIAPITTPILSGSIGQSYWFRSDVQLSLDAKDNVSGLGVDYTLYKIGDGDWTEYTTPINFTDEGSFKVEFYSVDNDENIEEVKSVSFNIDKTIPEAKMFIDPVGQDLIIVGIDQNQTIVERLDDPGTNNKFDGIYLIADLAGNFVELNVRYSSKETFDKFKIYSIRYNDGLPALQADNHFNIKYKNLKDRQTLEEQNFEVNNQIKIKIKYDFKDDQSTITNIENEEEKIKEVKTGLILLQLITNKGNLEYSY